MISGAETVAGEFVRKRDGGGVPLRRPAAPEFLSLMAWVGGSLLFGTMNAAESARPESPRAELGATNTVATQPLPVPAGKEMRVATNAVVAKVSEKTSPAEGSAASGPATGLDFPSFRMVADRNIFNADRTRRSSRSGTPSERPKQIQISTISLVGFLGSAQGDRAFFDGSSSSYRKALKAGESAGDLKLKSVCVDNAVVEISGKPFTLRVGDQLRREEEGPWAVSNDRTALARPAGDKDNAGGDTSTSSSEPAPPSTGDADTDSALQRLLKRRQQEENK